jgi:hypothetical protein
LSIDGKTGQGLATEDLFNSTLPEGLTPEIAKALDNHTTNFIAGGTLAFGELAVEAMKGNKKLEAAQIEIPMVGRNAMSVSVERQQEFVNHMSEDKEKVTKFGLVKTSVDIRGAKNAGELKKARSIISDLATAAFGTK